MPIERVEADFFIIYSRKFAKLCSYAGYYFAGQNLLVFRHLKS
jgi:hypothetical protein